MPEYPLLFFPKVELTPRVKRKPGMGPPPAAPEHKTQLRRIAPKLNQLKSAFDRQALRVETETPGKDYEQVLVFEVIDEIDNFASVANWIRGLEWLDKIELENIKPDRNFYYEDNDEKLLQGKVYLFMVNQRAIDQLLGLWELYKADEKAPFPHGTGKLRQLFKYLKDVRRWNHLDRLRGIQSIVDWKKELAKDADEVIRLEIELWFRQTESQRTSAEETIAALITQLNGRIIRNVTISEVHYHGLLAELPRQEIEAIVRHPNTRLTRSEEIMFLRPQGQFATLIDISDYPAEQSERRQTAPASSIPRVALLDGLPVQNHSLLQSHLVIDDPDNFETAYPATRRTHGTGMASLIINGDLNANEEKINSPLYVRPILRPSNSENREICPENELPVDLVYRAITRMFSGAGSRGEAEDVILINFSVCDQAQMFYTEISPFARLLDWLSEKYKVLFVVSTGNHASDLELQTTLQEIEAFNTSERERILLQSLYNTSIQRRLLAPSESINSITVGAIHGDLVTAPIPNHLLDLSNSGVPSAISALGYGLNRSIKPDIVLDGGRQLYRGAGDLNGGIRLSAARSYFSGQKVAIPGPNLGDLSSVGHVTGTSNSTALATRNGLRCLETLEDVLSENNLSLDRRYLAPTLKAMMIHGSSWGEAGTRIDQTLGLAHHLEIKASKAKWLGYGIPSFSRVFNCDFHRATLIGFGELNVEETNIFNYPIPVSLNSARVFRKVTITLAWLSKIVPRSQNYRNAFLWFELENEDVLGVKRSEADWNTVRRGTVQHEIFTGESATVLEPNAQLSIRVNCKVDAGKMKEPVAYGLFVTLETAEGVALPIYDEVKNSILTRVEVGPST